MSLTETPTAIPAPRIETALPAKIAGIVFWGMVLVGLLLSVFIMHIREKELLASTKSKIDTFTHSIEHVLEMGGNPEDIQRRLETIIARSRTNDEGVEALSMVFNGRVFHLGKRARNQDEHVRPVQIFRPGKLPSQSTVELRIYVPNLKHQIDQLRKNMLILVGSLVFIFGLILQQILQRFLSKPFITMVQTAEKFANGETQVRFNEDRSDEFGYLAKFINRALDTMVQHQQDLEISRQALFEEKERAEVTLQSIMDGVITLNADGEIIYTNPVAQRMCACSSASAHLRQLPELVAFINEDTTKRLPNPIDKVLNENISVELPTHAALVRRDGSSIPIEATAAPMRNDTGQVIGVVLVLQDVSHSRRLTRQLSYQASHDALTGLHNRRMFEEYLETALLNVREENRHHALCYIDLDQFKIVNDTCGHIAGDELLRQLAVLLQDCVRGGDILARLGGDEFGVLLENCPLPRAVQIAEKIRQNVKDFRFAWEDKSFEIGTSIGIVGISP